MEAYKVAGELLRGLADGGVELEQNIVDGARASMTYTYARQSETAGAAVRSSSPPVQAHMADSRLREHT